MDTRVSQIMSTIVSSNSYILVPLILCHFELSYRNITYKNQDIVKNSFLKW